MRKSLICLLLVSASMIAQTKPSPSKPSASNPNLYFSGDSSGFYSVGRWALADNEKMAFESETEIDCDPQRKFCVESTAELSYGAPHVNVEWFEVEKWDDNGIIATSSTSLCMVRTMVISFGAKSITASSAQKTMPKDKKEACKFFGADETDSEVFVVKNSERWASDLKKGTTR
jgi:hypothetical protein